MHTYRSAKWKPVKNSLTVSKTCPRCRNHVQFSLVYDYSWWMVGGLLHSKMYALKCPICVHVEGVGKSSVKAFLVN